MKLIKKTFNRKCFSTAAFSSSIQKLTLTALFLFSNFIFAQETSKTITVKSSNEKIQCSNDNTDRFYTLERKLNNEVLYNKYFNKIGCEFTITENLEPGNYTLTIFTYEYDQEVIAFEITANSKSITLNDVVLVEKINTLKEVVLTDRKKYIKVESDKTTINVKDNPLVSSGTALDAIKKMPGVVASPTGGFSLNGKPIVIYIDDAPNSLSGNDLKNYLSSLPAKAIDNIELIYNPGAAFDANASGSVINLVTSSVRLKGINANFNINYNFNKYQKPSPQILLNGKEKNLSWQTMIGYNYIDSEQKSENGQTFTSFNPSETIIQERLTVSTNRNFYSRIGTNYKLSKKSNLLLNYNATLSNNRNEFDAQTYGSSIPDYFNEGISKNKSSNHEVSLQYKTKLDTLGRKLDIIGFSNVFSNNPNSFSKATENNTNSTFITKNNFDLLNYYLKYDFTIPFQKYNFTLTTGGKFNHLDVNNIGKYNLNNPITSNIDFDYEESNLAFYAEARKKINKFNFTLGLRLEDFNINRTGIVENTASKVEFSNTNLFPNVSALYQLSEEINISSSYSRKIRQPNYNTLDPNGSSFDQYNTSGGNLLLNPVFFDNYDFKITALDYVQVGTNYSVAKDQNFFVFSAEPNELVSSNTFRQFDRVKTFSAYANFPIPLDYFFKGKDVFMERLNNIDRMNYIYLSVNYIKTTIDGYEFPFKQKPIWNYAAEAQILLPWDIRNSITYYILPPGNWEIYDVTKPIQQFDISFQKEFLDKKLKVGIHAIDLFNQNSITAQIAAPNLNTNFYEKNDSRVFRISLSYNFGNLKLDKENTNIETEKVKSGGGFVK
ncbi:outer membrane beta-barrel family protein [uncultured Flavobacterium sp.]|uniref:outer membrane beta-barrel family protein n=1 Tax=uncultured Flavobacterium sp. TaxID=165435 RepID=UPI0030ED5504